MYSTVQLRVEVRVGPRRSEQKFRSNPTHYPFLTLSKEGDDSVRRVAHQHHLVLVVPRVAVDGAQEASAVTEKVLDQVRNQGQCVGVVLQDQSGC